MPVTTQLLSVIVVKNKQIELIPTKYKEECGCFATSMEGSRLAGRLAARKQVPDDVHRNAWIFAESPHRVGMPAFAEWHIDSQRMAIGDQPAAECARHPKQHLKFVTALIDAEPSDGREGMLDEYRVMRGYADFARATFEQLFQEPHVRFTNIVRTGPGDVLRLDIDPLAKPQVSNASIEQGLHVRFRSSQARLDHGADIVMFFA